MKKTSKKNRRIRLRIIIFIFEILTLICLLLILVMEDEEYLRKKHNNINNNLENLQTMEGPLSTPRPTPIVTVKTKYKKGKLLQDHTVYHYSSYNRDINLKVASKKINGTKLMVGEEFEFYETIGGEPTLEKGFVYAGSLSGGRSVNTVGGGICEVATSLNTVIIDAGIKTNADTHSANVGYLNSTDHEATVAFGLHTLKFTNTLNYPILIKQEAINGNVRTRLYKMKTTYIVTVKDAVTGQKNVKKYSKKSIPKKYKKFILKPEN